MFILHTEKMYVSVLAIESDSQSRNQQCLTYWVLFSLLKMSETGLVKLLKWLPFWPYAKGVITILLVIRCFTGACYVYNHFVRPYVLEILIECESDLLSVDSIPSEEGFFSSELENFDVVDKNISQSAYESDTLVPCLGKVVFECETTECNNTWPSLPRRVQKEFCCALCLIKTSSARCLIDHLQGKKHRANEEELILYKSTRKKGRSPMTFKKTNGILIENLNHLVVNLENCWFLNSVTGPRTSCAWEKPKSGWTKLNTDGSVDSKGAGFGGLLRDSNGDPICAFVNKAPSDDIFSVELWAIWRGLVLARGLGIKVIWVESDSLSVVKTINRAQSYNQKAITFACLTHIWKLIAKFDQCKVSHSWREGNAAADYLAKMNLSENDVVLWPDDFPKKLCKIINDDARGKTYSRGNS
ncbi:hypothetical protein TIFTF001_009403 [Ficus carica]|uniref:RNase H type-1 domain-containing protein n=1 Tax=Ficus carica TaxID=3494 RepID=A0AA88D3K5_FICCA|nr:hypothetical protein TIFTF001_009403 [Ficus carica]